MYVGVYVFVCVHISICEGVHVNVRMCVSGKQDGCHSLGSVHLFISFLWFLLSCTFFSLLLFLYFFYEKIFMT